MSEDLAAAARILVRQQSLISTSQAEEIGIGSLVRVIEAVRRASVVAR